MPDKAITSVSDKCTSCAFVSEKGPVYRPWPTSHSDVCCLYKFNRQEQSSALCQKDVGQKLNGTSDGLCKDCPSRLKFKQLHVELPVEEPVPQTATDVASQEGITDVLPSCKSVHPGITVRKYSRIAPRKRRGFEKQTIEIRPPKFKKKLWFGTWQDEEIDRAKDAIKYYMELDEPFILSDSPLIFSKHPLGMKYQDLKPACDEFVQVGTKQVRASVYFARQVKEVIKAVTRGSKKKPQPSRRKLQTSKRGASDKKPEPLTDEPSSSESPSSTIVPGQSGSTSSSFMPCTASCSQSSPADDMVWCGANSEASSELAPAQPCVLPPSDHMLPYEGDIPIDIFSIWNVFSSEEIASPSFPSVAASGEGEGESAMLEDNSYTPLLWSI